MSPTPKYLDIPNVRELRVTLSAALNSLPVDHTAESRYNAIARTHIEFGRMWLGDLLRELGETSPYSKAGTTAGADLSEEKLMLEGDTTIQKLVSFRDFLLAAAEQIAKWIPAAGVFERQSALNNCYTHLKEARFALGMELASHASKPVTNQTSQ